MKNLTIVFTNKKQMVQTIVLVNMKMWAKSRRKMFVVVLIGMSWFSEIWCVLNAIENQDVKCSNIYVGRGESQTNAVNQSLCRSWKKNVGIEKVEYRGVMWLPLKGSSKKFQTSLCNVECWRQCGRCSSFWVCFFLSLGLERILFFVVLPSSNQINFGLNF